MVVYNFTGLNETLLDQELAMGNFSMLPDALSFCSTSAGGNAFVRVSGFQDSWWGGPSLNSTEILFGYYTSSLVSAQGWAPEPACAG